jgi:hypothetical protein
MPLSGRCQEEFLPNKTMVWIPLGIGGGEEKLRSSPVTKICRQGQASFVIFYSFLIIFPRHLVPICRKMSKFAKELIYYYFFKGKKYT